MRAWSQSNHLHYKLIRKIKIQGLYHGAKRWVCTVLVLDGFVLTLDAAASYWLITVRAAESTVAKPKIIESILNASRLSAEQTDTVLSAVSACYSNVIIVWQRTPSPCPEAVKINVTYVHCFCVLHQCQKIIKYRYSQHLFQLLSSIIILLLCFFSKIAPFYLLVAPSDIEVACSFMQYVEQSYKTQKMCGSLYKENSKIYTWCNGLCA